MRNKELYTARAWLVFLVALVLLRLALTGDREILATNSPHDEFWYIQNAFKRVWGGTYNQMTFMHLPVYSGWLAAVSALGVPARLAIDLCWLCASGYLAYAVYQLARLRWVAMLLFVFLAFHPYALSIFDRALAETLLTVLSAAVLAAAIELWNCRDSASPARARIALIIYGLGFALAYHTRKEGIVLAAPLLVLACCSLFDRQRWWRGGARPALALPILLTPLLMTLLCGAALAGANYVKWGVWSRYELAAPGYQRVVAALNSIDVGRTPRHITVTKAMLALAYNESPTFRELQPAMDGAAGQQWVAIASAFTPLPGEIGNGWFYWALRDVAASAGWHTDARAAEQKYAAAATELEGAFAAGRLKKKKLVLSSFLDPDYGKWLPELPTSMLNVSKLVVQTAPGGIVQPAENATPAELDDYAAVTGRRSAPPRLTLSGWIVAPAGSLIGLGANNAVPSWVRLGDRPRPDVPGAYAFTVTSTSLAGPTELHLLLPDGRTGIAPLAAFKVGATATLAGPAPAQLGIDVFESTVRGHRLERWLDRLCSLYEWAGYLLCGVAAAGLGAAALRRRMPAAAMILALAAAAVLARVTLFAILDASSWSGIQARYILPVLPFFACMGALGLALLHGVWRKK
jgi:hypothetical protein